VGLPYKGWARSETSLNREQKKKTLMNRSAAWKFFDKSPNSKVATCTMCGIKYQVGSATTSMMRHIRDVHKDHPVGKLL